MCYGRRCPPGHLPVFSVNTEKEAEDLLLLCCSRGVDGKRYAQELAAEQSVNNLAKFSQKLAKGYEYLLGKYEEERRNTRWLFPEMGAPDPDGPYGAQPCPPKKAKSRSPRRKR